jgi:hypothetical protein
MLVNCYFATEKVCPKDHWYPGNMMLVNGVLNRHGELVKCSTTGEGSGVKGSQLQALAPTEIPWVVPLLQ